MIGLEPTSNNIALVILSSVMIGLVFSLGLIIFKVVRACHDEQQNIL